jgi:hypothetical protein
MDASPRTLLVAGLFAASRPLARFEFDGSADEL